MRKNMALGHRIQKNVWNIRSTMTDVIKFKPGSEGQKLPILPWQTNIRPIGTFYAIMIPGGLTTQEICRASVIENFNFEFILKNNSLYWK